MRYSIALIVFTFLAAACGGSGLGKNVRQDVTATMQSAEGDLSKCYADALERDSNAAARMRLNLTVEAKTGAFQPSVGSNTSDDAQFEACVITTVSALKLAKPQDANLSTKYPLEFTPSN